MLQSLYIVRHAEAADGYPDEERALTDKGIRQSRRAGRLIERIVLPAGEIDSLVASRLLRAVQTAELLADAAGLDLEVIQTDGLEPEAPIENAFGMLHEIPGESAIVVGHNPHLEFFAAALLGATRFSSPVRLKKATVAWFERIQSGLWQLRGLYPYSEYKHFVD